VSSSLGLTGQPDRERDTLHAFLDEVAARHAGHVALRHRDPGRSEFRELRFDELQSASRALAKGLVGAGVSKGERVAVQLANRPEWAVAAFATSRVGAVLVPVNTFATPAERDYILAHSDACLLLMQPGLLKHDYVGSLRERHRPAEGGRPGRFAIAALPQLRRAFVLEEGDERGGQGVEGWSALLAAGDDVSDALLDALASEVRPADDGILIYTSGTTAHPKGVLHRQRAAVIQSWRFAQDMGLCPDDRILTAQPFFWTAGIAMSLGASLAAGACLLTEAVFDAGRYLEVIERERVTALHAWPHQEKLLAEHPEAASRDLSSLRKIEFSSPLAPLADLEQDSWGTYGSYGMTETFTLASSLPASCPAELRSGTSGRPLPGMEIRIVDPATGVVLSEAGARGEIAVRGVTLMAGYHKVDPAVYLDADGFFHTQDGGYFDADGYLHWTGRLSNLIKTGGANVSPAEIEAALAERDELLIRQAVGVPHPALGEVIVLCVVAREGSAPDEAGLRSWLATRLAAYKQPKRVLFFDPGEIQYTANQKIQIAPLRELALAKLQQEGAVIDGVLYEAASETG